jgi:hypothetical protein
MWPKSLTQYLPKIDKADVATGLLGLTNMALAVIPGWHSSVWVLPKISWASLAIYTTASSLNLRDTAKLHDSDAELKKQNEKLEEDMKRLHILKNRPNTGANVTLKYEEMYDTMKDIVNGSKQVHQQNNHQVLKDLALIIPYVISLITSITFSIQYSSKDKENEVPLNQDLAMLLFNILFSLITIYQIRSGRTCSKETKDFEKKSIEKHHEFKGMGNLATAEVLDNRTAQAPIINVDADEMAFAAAQVQADCSASGTTVTHSYRNVLKTIQTTNDNTPAATALSYN